MRFGRPRSAKDRAIAEQLLPMLDESIHAGLAELRPLIEADAEARKADTTTAEPDLPAAQGRNIRQPVTGAVG